MSNSIPRDDLNAAEKLDTLGDAHRDSFQFDKAHECYNEALRLRRVNLGDNHLEVGYSHNKIGSIMQKMDNLNVSIKSYEKALQIMKGKLGNDHKMVADTLYEMATIYKIRGERSNAMDCFREVVRIKKLVSEESDEIIPRALFYIANLQFEIQNFDEALTNFEESLRLMSNNPEQNKQYVAATYNNMGVIYQKQGQLGKAMECYKSSLGLKGINIEEPK